MSVPLILLGTWAALDSTSVGQFMISRPLVSSTLAGFLLGDSSTGLLMGLILEAAHLGDLPIGGARVLEPGPAGVVGSAAAIALGGPGGLALGTAIGMIWSQLGSVSVTMQRRLNGVLATRPPGGWRDRAHLSARHWGCIAADGVRGALLTAAGIGLVSVVPPSLVMRWRLGTAATVILLLLPGIFLCGDLLRAWGMRGKRLVLLGFGSLLGLLIGLVT